jgi:hypothetical protein
VLAKLVAAQPEKSDRQLAKQAGVSHPTIAKARRAAEATGKALPVDKRVGADGKPRKQPANKVKVKPAEDADAEASAEAIKATRDAVPDLVLDVVLGDLGDAEKKKEAERCETLAAEAERLASKLIELDRDTARAVHDLLWTVGGDIRLMCALAHRLDGDGASP